MMQQTFMKECECHQMTLLSAHLSSACYEKQTHSKEFTTLQVLAPNGKLIPPDQVFGEGGLFDKDVEEKTKLAFKVTMKKLEKYNTASEFNKEHLKTAKVDQVVECFPNTLLKLLPNTIQKTKWTKKSKEVENWDIWWSMHEKILQPLRSQAEVIHKW